MLTTLTYNSEISAVLEPLAHEVNKAFYSSLELLWKTKISSLAWIAFWPCRLLGQPAIVMHSSLISTNHYAPKELLWSASRNCQKVKLKREADLMAVRLVRSCCLLNTEKGKRFTYLWMSEILGNIEFKTSFPFRLSLCREGCKFLS